MIFNSKINFRKGDTVLVISGKDRNKKGEVIKVLPKKMMVLVSGINLKVFFNKKNQGANENFTKRECGISVSKVKLVKSGEKYKKKSK